MQVIVDLFLVAYTYIEGTKVASRPCVSCEGAMFTGYKCIVQRWFRFTGVEGGPDAALRWVSTLCTAKTSGL